MTSRAVVIMTKAPRAGSVKTRLAPVLGHERCAALQAVLLGQAVTTARSCPAASVYVAVDPPDALAEVAISLPDGCHVLAQSGRDLGERMTAASGEALSSGHDRVVIIGADVPLLRVGDLEEAFARLDSGCEVVFGPALDGGYYLVGFGSDRRKVLDIDPALWGGPAVLDASLALARELDLRIGLLAPRRDLDTADDAAAFLDSSELPVEIREALSSVTLPSDRLTLRAT